MAKLWQKDYTLDTLIERFTVGNDYILDQDLVSADCTATCAHVFMLAEIGILSDADAESIKDVLLEIISLHGDGHFPIRRQDEDVHTAIETFLTEKLGDLGKRVHTGRSRNDQVQTALRLWMRDMLIKIVDAGVSLTETVYDFARNHEKTPMPGRTHMQIAMPSTVGLWAAAYGEELADECRHIESVLRLIDQCPLGSAASYGVPLPLNRKYTADALGFSRVQNNVLYANNSRGKFESIIIDSLDYIALTLSKAAQDLMLFSLPEFGYMELPKELCSGSSIMPQKRNPDGLELMRSKAGLVSGYSAAVKNIIRSLPSGYNRDFQDTKEPLFKAAELVMQMIQVMELSFSKLKVHEDRLTESLTPELYATDIALDYVRQGMSFREAYKKSGADPESWKVQDPQTVIERRSSEGSPGNLQLELLHERAEELAAANNEMRDRIDTAVVKLMGSKLDFFRMQ